jgi:hypothetical protein
MTVLDLLREQLGNRKGKSMPHTVMLGEAVRVRLKNFEVLGTIDRI